MSVIITQTITQNGLHCTNLVGDRQLGDYWERQFCVMAAQYGKSFTPMQIGLDKSAQAFRFNQTWKHYTLPDVTIWTYPGEHHEIKHKNPTKSGMFGLEVYRFNALVWFSHETQQTILYTIHNHDLAGGRNITENRLEHWVTANINYLENRITSTYPGSSWVNGEKKTTDIHYWTQNLWTPLSEFWSVAI